MRNVPKSFAVWLIPSAGLFLFGACATTLPSKESIQSSRMYGKSYNEVWEAVLASLSEQNIRVTSMEKESGKIVAEDGTLKLRQFDLGRYDSTYCFCGSPEPYHVLRGLAGEYAISVTRGNEIRTSVHIDASYRASLYFGDRQAGWLSCLSKGVFEPLFLERVDTRLKVEEGPSRNVDWWKPSRGY